VIYVVAEISKGSRNKYEYDEQGGFVKLDRVLFSSLTTLWPQGTEPGFGETQAPGIAAQLFCEYAHWSGNIPVVGTAKQLS